MIRLNKKEKQAMGARLKAARDVAGLGVREVTFRLGVSSTNTVKGWENGSLPSEELRAEVAELYGRPERVLFAEYYAHIDAALALLEATA
jgi:transcriptional regulator with XRE-family HTH domain